MKTAVLFIFSSVKRLNLILKTEHYVYTEEELEAYRVAAKHRNICVNLYVPYMECTMKLPILRALLDPKYEFFWIIKIKSNEGEETAPNNQKIMNIA